MSEKDLDDAVAIAKKLTRVINDSAAPPVVAMDAFAAALGMALYCCTDDRSKMPLVAEEVKQAALEYARTYAVVDVKGRRR